MALNVFDKEDQRKKYLEKYFTEAGIKALEMRLKSLVELYMKPDVKYPMKHFVLGFVPLKIFSKTHHEGMIDECCQILGVDKVKVINNDSG